MACPFTWEGVPLCGFRAPLALGEFDLGKGEQKTTEIASARDEGLQDGADERFASKRRFGSLVNSP